MQKWYIPVLIALTTIIIVEQYNATPQNQELVLYKLDNNSNQESIQQTINQLQQKLKRLGAQRIKITTIKGGNYRITYHSQLDKDYLKQQLTPFTNSTLAVSHKPVPLNPASQDQSLFHLEINDINNDPVTSFNAVIIQPAKPISTTVDNIISFKQTDYKTSHQQSSYRLTQQSIIVNIDQSITLYRCLSLIPVVRAGPHAS